MVVPPDLRKFNAGMRFPIDVNDLKSDKASLSEKNGHTTQRAALNDKPCAVKFEESFEETPLLVAVITYIGYGILVCFGYFRDLLRYYGLEKTKAAKEKKNEVYVHSKLEYYHILSFVTRLLSTFRNTIKIPFLQGGMDLSSTLSQKFVLYM